MGGAENETLAIPQALRDAVDDRDGGFCRLCGKFLGTRRAIHHIYYGGDLQGMGGRRKHELPNLVSLCWLPGDAQCHDRVHAYKSYWQPLLAAVVTRTDHTTALQLDRWNRRKRLNHDEEGRLPDRPR